MQRNCFLKCFKAKYVRLPNNVAVAKVPKAPICGSRLYHISNLPPATTSSLHRLDIALPWVDLLIPCRVQLVMHTSLSLRTLYPMTLYIANVLYVYRSWISARCHHVHLAHGEGPLSLSPKKYELEREGIEPSLCLRKHHPGSGVNGETMARRCKESARRARDPCPI